jgi:DNA-binding LacI/PurR family transcriptional regulator
VDILLEEAEDPGRDAVQIVFQPELVIRESTRRPD